MMRQRAARCSPFKVAAAEVVVAVGWRRRRFFASVIVIRMLAWSSTTVMDQRCIGAGVVAALHGQQVLGSVQRGGIEAEGAVEKLATRHWSVMRTLRLIDFTWSTFELSLPGYAPAVHARGDV